MLNLLNKKYATALSAAIFASASFSGCGPNEAILRSNVTQQAGPASNTPPAYDSVEKEIENMRTADFNFILVLRRKDGGVMQAADKTLVRTITTNANRRSLADGEKAIVIGANVATAGDVVKKLAERFDVQDYSTVGTENINSNSAANANIVH